MGYLYNATCCRKNQTPHQCIEHGNFPLFWVQHLKKVQIQHGQLWKEKNTAVSISLMIQEEILTIFIVSNKIKIAKLIARTSRAWMLANSKIIWNRSSIEHQIFTTVLPTHQHNVVAVEMHLLARIPRQSSLWHIDGQHKAYQSR